MASTLGIKLEGKGWEKFAQRIANMQVGAREMARAKFLVGSTLPYASHWIEDGFRDDPRFGRVVINYRAPAATHFMAASAQAYGGHLSRRRPTGAREPIGAVLGAGLMQLYADAVADSMRMILNAEVYSLEARNPRTGRTWQRKHALYNSIRVYRA